MSAMLSNKTGQIIYENCKGLNRIVLPYVEKHPILTYCSAGIAAFTLIAYKLSFRKRFVAWLFYQESLEKLEKYEAVKRELLKPLAEQISSDPKLREEKSLRILEVGVGAGSNFDHYPEGCHLIAVDPNPHFVKYYEENRAKFPQIKSAKIIVTTGENMDMVDSNSVDAVVVTWVLCSVSDLAKFVSQVKRVMAPGGKFYFLEHVGEWDLKKYGTRRRCQQFWTSVGIWPFIFDGCSLTSDPMPTIRAVGGFTNIQTEYFYAPIPAPLLQPHLKGIITK